jgi:hypothetical protein
MLPDLRILIAASFITLGLVALGIATLATIRSGHVKSVMTPTPRSPVAEQAARQAATPESAPQAPPDGEAKVETASPPPSAVASPSPPDERAPDRLAAPAAPPTAPQDAPAETPASAEPESPAQQTPPIVAMDESKETVRGGPDAADEPSIRSLIEAAEAAEKETTASIGNPAQPVAEALPTTSAKPKTIKRKRARATRRARPRPSYRAANPQHNPFADLFPTGPAR